MLKNDLFSQTMIFLNLLSVNNKNLAKDYITLRNNIIYCLTSALNITII